MEDEKEDRQSSNNHLSECKSARKDIFNTKHFIETLSVNMNRRMKNFEEEILGRRLWRIFYRVSAFRNKL